MTVFYFEGAGGLMVPLTTELLTIDYIVQEKYPLIFVTSGKLGSINHTLLSLEAIQKRGIVLDTVLYNLYQCRRRFRMDKIYRTWLKKVFSGNEVYTGSGNKKESIEK